MDVLEWNASVPGSKLRFFLLALLMVLFKGPAGVQNLKLCVTRFIPSESAPAAGNWPSPQAHARPTTTALAAQ